MPKPNFYQSLHTTVMGEKGHAVRGPDPHARDGPDRRARASRRTGSTRRAGSAPRADDARFAGCGSSSMAAGGHRTRAVPRLAEVDLYPGRGLHLHPEGRGVRVSARRHAGRLRVPRSTRTSATTASGARVNGKLVPLQTPLQNGDIVEILTSPDQRSRARLALLRSSPPGRGTRSATSSTREEKRAAVELGRRLLERELKKCKRSVKKLEADGALARTCSRVGLRAGRRPLRGARLRKGRAAEQSSSGSSRPRSSRGPSPRAGIRASRPRGPEDPPVRRCPTIEVVGHDDLLATLAKCCNPVPGEPIVGYITRGRGVSVHSASCPNVTNLLFDPERRSTWRGRQKTGRPTRSSSRSSRKTGRACWPTSRRRSRAEGSNIRWIEAACGETRRGRRQRRRSRSTDMKQLEKILGASAPSRACAT